MKKKEPRGRKPQLPIGTMVQYKDFLGKLQGYTMKRTGEGRTQKFAEILDSGILVGVPAAKIRPAKGKVISVKMWM